jgi:cytochrome c5
MNKMYFVLAIAAVAMTGCAGSLGKGEPGYDLVNSKCGHCHFTGVKKAHTTKEEWEQTVTKMIGKGAKLNEAEKATVVDFLVKYYHP